MPKCPNKSSKEFKKQAELLGEDLAYHLWDRNNGNPLTHAPNGKPSKLYKTLLELHAGDERLAHEAKAKVYTKGFMAWFGEWMDQSQESRAKSQDVSKVVDGNGEPLVVWHGSSNGKFHVFDPSKGNPTLDGGMFFSNSKSISNKFAGPNGNTLGVYLKIANPMYGSFSGNGADMSKSTYRDGGIFTKKGTDRYANEGDKEFIVFSPNQIKSATENSGAFSSKSDDIRFKRVDGEAGKVHEVYRSPEYKTAKKVQDILRERGIEKPFSVSETDYGNSMYFTVYGENQNQAKLKIRISDHSVSNYDRIFNEEHFNATSDPEKIADEIELAMYPERYDKIQTGVRYYSKYNNDWLSAPDENGEIWTKEVQEMSEKAINDLHPNNIRVVDKEFLRESKSGNKIYKVTFERKHAYGEEPTYKYVRKNDIRFKRVDGEDGDGGQQVVDNADTRAAQSELDDVTGRMEQLKADHKAGTVTNRDYAKRAFDLSQERKYAQYRLDKLQKGESVESLEELLKKANIIDNGQLTVDNLTQQNTTVPPTPPVTGAQAVAEAGGELLPEKLRDELDARMERGLSKWAFAVQEAYQDEHLAVKIFEDTLRKNGLEITPRDDWYMRVTSLGGMNDSQMEYYERDFNLPLMHEVNKMEKTFSYRAIENYMMLKHGLERNDWMQKDEAKRLMDEGKPVPPSLYKKDFSGITAIEAETGMSAEEFINDFEQKYDTTHFWELVNKATKNAVQIQFDRGMIDKATYDDLKTRYQYYIPLRGFDKEVAEDRWDYSPDMGTHFVKPVIKANGRTSRAEKPFAYIFQMNHSAITSGNKNYLNQAWVRLARKDKSGMLILKQAWYTKAGQNEDGTPIWEQQSPVWSDDPELYAANIEKFEQDMKALEEKGEAIQKRGRLTIGLFTKPKQAAQHELHVFENGTEHVVYINANPKVARAINGDNRVEAGKFFEGMATINRWMAANFTSRNPLFMVTNFERDITFATTTLGVKEGIVYQAHFVRNVPIAVKAITAFLTGHADPNNKWDMYAREYVLNGGRTGYTHLVELKAVQKRIEEEIAKDRIKRPSAVLRMFEMGNAIAENTTRLATYITSREMGRPVSRAISDAKEVTVNFNRKGSGALGADEMRKSFLFFNVAVQALANSTKMAKEHPWRMAGLLASFVATGLLMPIINMLIGGDEAEQEYSKLSDYDRQNNMCLWTGNGFVKWALPQELRVFHALGDNIYQHSKGNVTNTELAVNTVVGLTDLLPVNPMGAVKAEPGKEWRMLGNSVTPDLMKPFMQLALNVTYTGQPVYNEWANPADPGMEQASKNKKGEPFAPAILVWAMQETDKLTGGDGVLPGKVSPNPDIVNHFMRGYLGGLWTTAIKGIDTGSKLVQGEEVKLRSTPLSTFYTSADDITENNAKLRDEYNQIKSDAQDGKHYVNKYRQKIVEQTKGENDLLKVATFTHKMNVLATKKLMATNNIINAIDRIESKEKVSEEPDKLRVKAEKLKKKVIELNNAESVEKIDKIIFDLRKEVDFKEDK